MKKIYSTVDAQELEEILKKGFIVKGKFAFTMADFKEEIAVEGELEEVLPNDLSDRFKSKSECYPLFQLVGIYEFTYLEEFSKVEGREIRLKAGAKIKINEKYPSLAMFAGTCVGGQDLLKYYEFTDGSTIGKLQKVPSWRL